MRGLLPCELSEKHWTKLDTLIFPSSSELEQVRCERLLSYANSFVHLTVSANLCKAHADGANFVIVLPPAYFMSLMTEEAILDYYRSVTHFLIVALRLLRLPMLRRFHL